MAAALTAVLLGSAGLLAGAGGQSAWAVDVDPASGQQPAGETTGATQPAEPAEPSGTEPAETPPGTQPDVGQPGDPVDGPTDPAPTDPAPTDPAPTDPAPADTADPALEEAPAPESEGVEGEGVEDGEAVGGEDAVVGEEEPAGEPVTAVLPAEVAVVASCEAVTFVNPAENPAVEITLSDEFDEFGEVPDRTELVAPGESLVVSDLEVFSYAVRESGGGVVAVGIAERDVVCQVELFDVLTECSAADDEVGSLLATLLAPMASEVSFVLTDADGALVAEGPAQEGEVVVFDLGVGRYQLQLIDRGEVVVSQQVDVLICVQPLVQCPVVTVSNPADNPAVGLLGVLGDPDDDLFGDDADQPVTEPEVVELLELEPGEQGSFRVPEPGLVLVAAFPLEQLALLDEDADPSEFELPFVLSDAGTFFELELGPDCAGVVVPGEPGGDTPEEEKPAPHPAPNQPPAADPVAGHGGTHTPTTATPTRTAVLADTGGPLTGLLVLGLLALTGGGLVLRRR